MKRTWSVVGILVLVGGLLAACDKDDEPVCGNGVCEDGETATSCAADCGGAVCGNGAIEGTEACDGAALGTHTCVTAGFAGGDLACSSTCTLDTSGCVAAVCGNGSMEGTEACDGDDLGVKTCLSQGFFGGDLACTDTCTLDTTGCLTEGCGDDVKNGTEACDGDDFGTTTCETEGHDGGTLACNASCELVETGCCDNACPAADDLRCTGDVLEICATGGNGCLAWQTEQNCAATDLICDDTGATPVCVPDCTDNCTTVGATQCAGDLLQTCEVQTSGCRDWSDTNCAATGDACFELAGGAVCADPCQNLCSLGDSRCSGGNVETCQANAYGCRSYVLQTTCDPATQYCEVVGGDAQCTTNGTGESCSDVQVVFAPFTVDGTDIMQDYANDHAFTGAGCDAASGVEAVLAIDLLAGQTLRLREAASGLDSIIRVLPTCDATAACLLSEDYSEGTWFRFEAPADGRYFVVLEAWSASPGSRSYALDGEVYDPETDCDDGVDNDADGLTDCADPSCFGATGCTTETVCGDGEDNDLDTLVDCDDPDCTATPSCWTRDGQFETYSASNRNDLLGCTVTFTPAAGDYNQTWTCPGYADFPILPGSGTVDATSLTLSDDGSYSYVLQGGWNVPFYGWPFASVWIGANGYVTFGQSDSSFSSSNFFTRARVAALMADLAPNQGGAVLVDEFADHLVVTFDAVPRYAYGGGGPTVSVQIVLHADGTIELTYVELNFLDGGTAGLSNGAAGTSPPAVDLVPPRAPAAGEVIFSEFMWNPDAVLDTAGEYIELRSVAAFPRVLDGCTITHHNGANLLTYTFPAGTSIAAGGYQVVAASGDATTNGGISGALEWSGIVLGNGDTSMKDFFLTCGATLVDTVDFGQVAWPAGGTGIAAQLGGQHVTAAANDDPAHWCSATAAYGDGDLGTPGAANGVCATTFYSNDLETDPAWTVTGDWQWGTPSFASGPAACAGGTSCYGTNLAGAYANSRTFAANYLQAGPFDLSTITGGAVLGFDMWLAVESGYDYAQVQVSTNGTTFTPLVMTSPAYNATSSRWTGETLNAWRSASANLSAYAGQATVYIRFALSSDSSDTRAGFYVDNLAISSW
jgi:hypothetical protein